MKRRAISCVGRTGSVDADGSGTGGGDAEGDSNCVGDGPAWAVEVVSEVWRTLAVLAVPECHADPPPPPPPPARPAGG